jgi:hypothetical protein
MSVEEWAKRRAFMDATVIDFSREEDRKIMQGRFPECPYISKCDEKISRGIYPAYFCQCHHGRKLGDPEFRHDAVSQ